MNAWIKQWDSSQGICWKWRKKWSRGGGVHWVHRPRRHLTPNTIRRHSASHTGRALWFPCKSAHPRTSHALGRNSPSLFLLLHHLLLLSLRHQCSIPCLCTLEFYNPELGSFYQSFQIASCNGLIAWSVVISNGKFPFISSFVSSKPSLS